ncbi:IucA/IucC family protein [Paenibacillus radicis (ex Gao et al. 2016)]|uniref:Siderophore biosynthesis protein IucA n=1 Tax=Paenibacillus radicis (ex Gao et al. 2016) TaxID=1737354 RepID=A0A917M0C2_9BACL|nr:IucA/IucC family protein [Paenibacillus radicis (ex Gao et al. 2016)]GGG68286.1 siderophore biosynthesis protein IucA [Paenibacillus radicis (ex Gao et al. 2016)]
MSESVWSIVQSKELAIVRRRIFRQLIESFLYERILTEPIVQGESEAEYSLHGQSETGEAVQYRFTASQKWSFGRIRLSEKPVVRIAEGEIREAESLPQFILEISSSLNAKVERISSFIDEIQQTLLKDTMSVLHHRKQASASSASMTAVYDEWEGDLIEGHPYHPCYKSRIGFTLRDNEAYGPEFKPDLRLIWVAVHRSSAKLSISRDLDDTAFMRQELGEDYGRFAAILEQYGKQPGDYILMPVHPWQWDRVIAPEFAEQLRTDELIYLGCGSEVYRPQQSIRTLANTSDRSKAYVKLPMNITNTSSGRILAQHTIMNAARISDWLGSIVAEDTFLHKQVILLKEVLGVSYHHQKLPNVLEQKVYGSLGAIWRESLHGFLLEGEEAYPFNALVHTGDDGQPLIHPWIEEYGLEEWLQTLLRVSLVPLVHLLYAHGAALESHGQNMIIVMERGRPRRIALKDFHDGVRYSLSVEQPREYPNIEYPPANHQRPNRNSFIEKEKAGELTDFLLDALLLINLAELAFFLEKHYGLSERRFWQITASVIQNYQKQFPELQSRFDLFDVFKAEVEVEQLTKRRIDDGTIDCVHWVSNPLHAYAPERYSYYGE